jgi:ankyrin repeat protein
VYLIFSDTVAAKYIMRTYLSNAACTNVDYDLSRSMQVLCTAHDTLYKAVASRDVSLVSQLLDGYANGALASDLVNMHLLASVSEGHYLLGLAVAQDDLPMTTLLLTRGALVNVPPICVMPALCTAAANDQLAMVGLLLSHGADAALPDHMDKRTPLMLAVEHGHAAVVKLLLETPEGRRSANIRCSVGMSALDYTKSRVDREVLVELLACGLVELDPSYLSPDADLLAQAPYADVLAVSGTSHGQRCCSLLAGLGL